MLKDFFDSGKRLAIPNKAPEMFRTIITVCLFSVFDRFVLLDDETSFNIVQVKLYTRRDLLRIYYLMTSPYGFFIIDSLSVYNCAYCVNVTLITRFSELLEEQS